MTENDQERAASGSSAAPWTMSLEAAEVVRAALYPWQTNENDKYSWCTRIREHVESAVALGIVMPPLSADEQSAIDRLCTYAELDRSFVASTTVLRALLSRLSPREAGSEKP